ncbi:hypothetical protein HO173_011103 [Letharia columbiana]|uniref:Uncharacterized protein n=1 Tax=Letharia columbiana TaxID=112416 RepID=A0A8H6L039_9LECA|nr:uncharacterized protein HO173_011103 [Letharia columbiana]KAF6230566.1 hypothetical protein HO173_011103 [Letharia columbiana]
MRTTTIVYTILLLAAPAFTLPLHLDAIRSLVSRQLSEVSELSELVSIDDGPPKMGADADERICINGKC